MKKKAFNNEIDLLEILLTILNNKKKVFLIAALTTAVVLLLGLQIAKDDRIKITTQFTSISIFDENLYEGFNFVVANPMSTSSANTMYLNIFFTQKIDSRMLLNLFETALRDDMEESVNKFFLSKREGYDNEKVYQDAVLDFLSSIKVNTQKKIIEFNSHNIDSEKDWLNFLSFLELNINKSIQKFLQLKMSKTLNAASLIKKNNIEDLKKKIEILTRDYKLQTKMRLSFLEEQAILAREGNVATSIDTTTSLNLESSQPLYYLKGYQVIEKEIELIKKRTSPYNFVNGLSNLEKEIDTLINHQAIKRINLEFNKTPIFNDDKFSAGSIRIASTKFKRSKITIYNMIFVSSFIGIIIGVLYVLMQNTFLIKLKSRRN